MSKYSKELKIMKEAAALAGASLTKNFQTKLDIKIKSTNADFVTQADMQANSIIEKTIKQNLPHVNVYSEEAKIDTKNKEYVLVVDPLDGTNNLVLGIPTFSSALTLLHNNKVVVSVINLPITAQMYWCNGENSYLNKTKLKTSSVKDLNSSTLAYQQDYLSHIKYKTSFESKFKLQGVARVLNSWSPQFEFGLLASGKIEGIYARHMVCYDYLGGLQLAQIAGAKVYYIKKSVDLVEDDTTLIVAANQTILNKMKEVLNI